MKIATAFYSALAALGTTAAILVPLAIYQSGSSALPVWQSAVQPGLLSAAHAFLNTKCESCHTPNRGVEASACLGCHTYAPELLAKEDTAFHATARQCADCHLEHQGGDRPIRMDHAALLALGAAGRPNEAGREASATLQRVLEEAMAALGSSARPLKPDQAARLDCSSCHAAQDPHRSRLGTTCQSCHGIADWHVEGWRHPSPRSTDCAQCHQPPPSHAGEHFLMRAQRAAVRPPTSIEQCYLCHKTNSFRSVRGVRPDGHM